MSTQNPLSLRPDNETQPDLALLKPRADRYRDALPSAVDVPLVAEVARTTGDYYREIKLPLYARHTVAEVWLIDLVSGTLEIHREPVSRGYRQRLRPERREAITPALIANVNLPSGEIGPT